MLFRVSFVRPYASSNGLRRRADSLAMGLPPLEYIDCFLDSPSFREMLSQYERELEENSAYVKQLVKECKRMILATEGACAGRSEGSVGSGRQECVNLIS